MTTDPRDTEPEEDIGGDPVCWAQFVCAECGAMTTEGHREGCPASAELGQGLGVVEDGLPG